MGEGERAHGEGVKELGLIGMDIGLLSLCVPVIALLRG